MNKLLEAVLMVLYVQALLISPLLPKADPDSLRAEGGMVAGARVMAGVAIFDFLAVAGFVAWLATR